MLTDKRVKRKFLTLLALILGCAGTNALTIGDSCTEVKPKQKPVLSTEGVNHIITCLINEETKRKKELTFKVDCYGGFVNVGADKFPREYLVMEMTGPIEYCLTKATGRKGFRKSTQFGNLGLQTEGF